MTDKNVLNENRPFYDYLFINAKNYKFKTWKECFPDNKVNIRKLLFNKNWDPFFDLIEKKSYFNEMNKLLSDYIANGKIILPYAELVFNIFNVLSPKDIKVVFLGQDPYPGMKQMYDKIIPQAMGFSFSVPLNYPKPMSLNNIFGNLLDYKHIEKIPDTGCLIMWVLQGCFMLNSSLTTFFSEMNAHKKLWEKFTNDLLEYLNDNFKNIIFLAWGKSAHMMCQKIDPYKHYIITSSHPSPMSFNKNFTGLTYSKNKNKFEKKEVTYPSFNKVDHFGRINEYLKKKNKTPIIWDLFNF